MEAVSRTPARLAAGLAAGSTVCCVAAVVIAQRLGPAAEIEPVFWGDLVLGTAWPVAGALVVRSAPRNPVGWVLLAAALIGPYELCGYYAAADAMPGRDLPGAALAAWVSIWGFVPYFFVLPLVLLLFPDGQPLTPRWRPVVAALVTLASLTTLTRMVSPVTADISSAVVNPLGISWEWLNHATRAGALICLFGGITLGVVSILLRTRRAVGQHRTQMQWLLLGGIVLLAGFVGPWGSARAIALSVGLLALPVAIVIAILRHGLFDVAIALNRTIVLLLLSGLVVAGYAAAVLSLGSVGGTSGPGLLLVAGAALLAASLRSTVQRAVDRTLFGHRGDPYAVVTRVGRHLAPASEPLAALALLVEALRKALQLPYVAYWDHRTEAVLATSGEPVAGWEAAPAAALGQVLGELRVGNRPSGERLGSEEREAIAEVAARAGTLAYAAGLVADVAESRSRIVVAREEERRRLRDDLHDELGPTLAGVAHQLDALSTRLRSAGDDDNAHRAGAVRDRMRATVRDVRSIVHGLRPPVLDQRGLGGALHSLVEGIDTPQCSTDLDLPDPLPAAVEVAAYAIAAEAVANALRHSAGSTLTIVARASAESVVVEVIDNGQGVHDRTHAGIGLRSMSERAAEVGGRLDLLVAPGGGTRVVATLPRRAEESR